MLRVLILTDVFPPETIGGATHTYDMAYHLQELGCDVEVLSSYPNYPFGEFKRRWKIVTRERVNGIKVTRLLSLQPHSATPSFIARFSQYTSFPLHAGIRLLISLLFHRNRYDVIVTSQPPDTTIIVGYLLRRLFGLPWVIAIRDLWQENAVELGFTSSQSPFYRLLSSLKRRAYKHVDLVAYTAETIRKRLERDYEINGKFVFNPNGIDPATFYPRNVNRNKNLLYLGNIGYVFDFESVIEALKYISDPDIKLIILGGGDKKRELQHLVTQHGVDSRVEFPPLITDKAELQIFISGCLLGICPIRPLGVFKTCLPIKVLEYMGAGIPFVACGLGEVEALATESGAGIIVRNEPQEFARAINTLIEETDLREEMGIKGREYVITKFNKPKTVANLYNELEGILNQKEKS
ncbi:MAG: glycosyltransferase family 4 protein [Planctomycetes bacterium]|nr:glycosyltransferase family 4 protein [Planctomycetota bacterium]